MTDEDKDWMEPDEGAPELEEVDNDDDTDLENKSYDLGGNKLDTIRRIVKAKKNSKQRAGLVKNTESGSTWEEDEPEDVKIPSASIHEFENMVECVCDCHPNKKDCMNCYDHPEHLEKKRNMRKKDDDGYDEEKILELIEQDKSKKDKKHWWQKEK